MVESSVSEFQSAAAAFCVFAERTEPVQKSDLWTIRELLLRLMFHIPAVEAHAKGTEHDGRRPTDEEYASVAKRFRDFPFNFYRVVFDPHDFEASDEPVTGMLSDDLSDIYRDLAEGLDSAQKGFIDDACFEWKQSYNSHWARHAVNALAAIEIYRTDNYERFR